MLTESSKRPPYLREHVVKCAGDTGFDLGIARTIVDLFDDSEHPFKFDSHIHYGEPVRPNTTMLNRNNSRSDSPGEQQPQ